MNYSDKVTVMKAFSQVEAATTITFYPIYINNISVFDLISNNKEYLIEYATLFEKFGAKAAIILENPIADFTKNSLCIFYNKLVDQQLKLSKDDDLRRDYYKRFMIKKTIAEVDAYKHYYGTLRNFTEQQIAEYDAESPYERHYTIKAVHEDKSKSEDVYIYTAMQTYRKIEVRIGKWYIKLYHDYSSYIYETNANIDEAQVRLHHRKEKEIVLLLAEHYFKMASIEYKRLGAYDNIISRTYIDLNAV